MLSVGLVVGLVVGAGGMYLALEQPWRSSGAAKAEVTPDAGPEVATTGKGKKKKPRRRTGGGGGGVGDVGAGDVAEPPPIVLSAADVAMKWKGDVVERPAATLDLGGEGESRSLSAGEIQEALDASGAGLQQCVIDAVGAAPFSGEVTVVMLVDGSGRADKVRVRAPAFMHEKNVLGCVRKASARMRYAAVGGWTVVTVPFPIEL
jgi:hypothetical protein